MVGRIDARACIDQKKLKQQDAMVDLVAATVKIRDSGSGVPPKVTGVTPELSNQKYRIKNARGPYRKMV